MPHQEPHVSERVEPRLARGLRDLLPEQMSARQRMIDTIRRVYELYGFVPLSTPAIEYLDVLSGSAGQEAQAGLFKVEGPDDEALGLRFDLTVPLARVVAQYRDLPRPFRRYQVSPVWRADKPGPGRFREFTQFDLDSVGVESELADTEIIAAMCDTLSALGVAGYLVRFSSRAVLNLLLPYAGIPAALGPDVFRVLDKIEKIGLDKVKLELTKGYRDDSGDFIEGLDLARAQVEKIERFLAIRSERREDVLGQVGELFASLEGAGEAIDTLARISRHLRALGYGDERVAVDLSVARGLAYYTGPVFEAVLTAAPQFGSVFGGGRYDDLVLRFLGERVPATGASIGVDRLLAALVHLGTIRLRKSTAEVLVTAIDPALTSDYLEMAYELRRAGIPTELYLGTERGPGRQVKHADRCEIPIALVYGGDEKARGVVALKDMQAGKQKSKDVAGREAWRQTRPGQREVPRAELVSAVRALLREIAGG
jgi:histidyl-tRNA synthetase